MDGQEIKQQAIAKAKELEIDKMVRMIAKSGSCDGAGLNYYADWEDMKIHATFGAGTNSASVQWRGKKLYHASNYGQYIDVFRFGPWVERMKTTQPGLELKQKENDRLKYDQENTKLIEDFSEVGI